MGCAEVEIGGARVHICSPTISQIEIRWQKCFDKKCRERKTPHIVQYYEWYEPDRCCLRCGRTSTLTSEGVHHHDFSTGRGVAPRERVKNKENWKARYRRANEASDD